MMTDPAGVSIAMRMAGLERYGIRRSVLFHVRTACLALAAFVAIGAANPLPASAGASPPQQPAGAGKVDLRDASLDAIRLHILDTCVVQQWGASTSATDSYAERCNCYARRITQAFSEDELAAFRRTAVYSATARPKALAARAECKL